MGPPESTALPRVQYWATSDMRESESKGTIIRVKNYVFTIWGNVKETVDAYIELIETAFLNAEQAATNPLTMAVTRGVILGTHLGEKSNDEQDVDIWRGRLGYEVRYSRLNQIPG